MAKIQELEDFKLSDAVKFNDTLNPAIWQDEKLKPDVREQLEKIARHFAEYLGVSDLKVEDITISGSNAAFTWTPHSDLDLHLLVDFSKLPDSDIYRELFNAKKMLYNDDHAITVKGLPVELYVQDINDIHHSMGAYSVLNDDWISIPKKEKPNFDEAATKLKYEKLGELVELALKSKDLKKVENVLSIIKRYRKAGLEKTGEFGPENIAFKAVRKHGLIQKLFDLKKELESKDLSIDEQLNETVEESEIVNILANYATEDILRLLNIKDKNALDYILGIDADKDRKEKLLNYGIDFLDLKLPKIQNQELVKILKELRVKVQRHPNPEQLENSDSFNVGSYNTFSQILTIYIDVLKYVSKAHKIPVYFKLAETIAHEIQHHIDNYKSEGDAFNHPNPTNREEYLSLPYEVNARMQEAFYNMAFMINVYKKRNETISNRELAEQIVEILHVNDLDDIYQKHQAEYKQLVKRIYKYADKAMNSPKEVVPATFAQKVVSFITGKHNLGTINENEYSSFRYHKNPTPNQLYTLTKKSAHKHLRGIYHNGKTYWWDANDAIHKIGAEILGLPYDYTKRLEAAIDGVSGNYYVGGDDGVPEEIIQRYNVEELVESSGYIPSEKEKNDPRFSMALTKDVRPNAIKKNAKAFSWKTNRAGIPPEAKTNGKINETKLLTKNIITSYKNNSLTINEMITKLMTLGLSYSYIADVTESVFTGNKTFNDKFLLENKDERLYTQLDKLVKSYSVFNPIIGEKYIPVMFMLINDRLQFFDVDAKSPSEAPATFGILESINSDHLLMDINGKTRKFPNEVIREVSYFSVILVDSEEKYQKLRTQVSLQFDVSLPEFSNTDIMESLITEWEQFLKEEQLDMFPGYDERHRAKRLEQWLLNTAVWDGAKPKIVYHATTRNFDQFKTANKGFASVMGQAYEVDRHGAFFAEDPKFAEEFILPPDEWENANPSKYKEDAVVIPVYLSIQNPIDLTDQGLSRIVRDEEMVEAFEKYGIDILFIYRHMYEDHRWQLFDEEEGARFVNALKEIGFDGAVMNESPQHTKSGRVWVAFYPSQIKSAVGNRGSFSKDDPRITKESY